VHIEGRVEQLSRVPLFAKCSKRQLKSLAADARVEQVEPGERLVGAGATSHDLYLVLAGTVRIERDGAAVDRVGPGGFVGELGLLLDAPRNADVVADTPLEVLCLDRPALQRALDTVPGLGWTLLSTLAERIDQIR
jgi:CRP-like cAMP-binding protein